MALYGRKQLIFFLIYWGISYDFGVYSKGIFHPCKSNKLISAEFLSNGSSVLRIKVCACMKFADTSFLVAQPKDRCKHPISLLQVDSNTPSDENCVVSKPIDFDPSRYNGQFSVCPCNPTESSISNSVVAQLNPRYRSERSVSANDLLLSPVIDFRPAVITGLRVEEAEKGVTYDDGASVVLAGTPVTVRLFGFDFSDSSEFRFVLGARERGADCDNLPFTVAVHVDKGFLTMFSTLVRFRLPSADQISDANMEAGESLAFYVCSLERTNGYNRWIHQGREPGVKLRTFQRSLPLWIQMTIIAILLSLSGLFSGLNLGLMALDRTELKIYENTGLEKEKRYAKAIIPVRNHGNYLLCTLLLGNVLVNSTLTILLDDLTSGVIAIVGSTIGIVIFGEIIPQAICSRYGLAIGAHTIWITKFFMLITFPMSYPISLILDRILGEELGAYYNRERLKELIKVTNEYHDLEKEEVNIIAGALELRRKTVGDIMTKLEDVFMLSYNSVMDFETVSEIMKQGFSRIPVYEGERSNIVALLFIKELALLDPEDATPLKTLCQFYQNHCNFVFEDTTLDVIFKEFKEGHKGHMAFVQRVNCEGEGDPFYETVGLVTLEDVIEELIQAEIVDETDVWMDNRSKRRREKGKLLQDFSSFAVKYREQTVHTLSPQLALAAFQFLTSCIEAFKAEWISENVLRRLMQQSHVVRFIRVKHRDKPSYNQETLLFQQGKQAENFVLILEGRVEVTVGKENLVFESGPFSYFGLHVLTSVNLTVGVELSSSVHFRGSVQSIQSPLLVEHPLCGGGSGAIRNQTSIVDYTVRPTSDLVYICMSRSLYQSARRATLLERNQRENAQSTTEYENEFENAFLKCKEEADLLNNVTNEATSSYQVNGGAPVSFCHRPHCGTRDGWSRCNLNAPVYRYSEEEKESLLNSSLQSIPNEITRNITAYPTLNQSNENEEPTFSRCARDSSYIERYEKWDSRQSNDLPGDLVDQESMCGNVNTIENVRLALVHSAKFSNLSS